jgi:1,2-diacylglycerol 3-alpha-glucosyltransferase
MPEKYFMDKLNTVRTRANNTRRPATRILAGPTCKVAVIWIDWYAYHVARFSGLQRNQDLAGKVAGIEMVGGVGVHVGLKFREALPGDLPIRTLLPESSWGNAGKWQLARLVWQRLNLLNPAVVLVPGYYTLPALAAAAWAKLKGKKAILMTESTAHDHTRVWWREAIKKMMVLNLFDWAVTGGTAHRRYLQQLGFREDRVAQFYDVVDNSFFHDCCQDLRSLYRAAEFDLPSEYFLYVGRIASEKNVDSLLAAYLTYRQSGGTWALVMVGDGPQLKELQAKAAATPYAREIYFPGLKGTSELPKYYAFASAFVLASTREPWGLVVNEAMAAGLPVIVSDRCGCVEDLVVNGENGFVFDPSDVSSLAESLTKVSGLSKSERQKMGRRSYQIVSQFTPDAWASEIARIVKSQI